MEVNHTSDALGLPRLERRGALAAIRFANPPVNALNNTIRQWLEIHIDDLLKDHTVAGVVFLAEGRCFVAGADLVELTGGVRPPFLGDILQRIEASPKPFVAALQGDALGGGMEIVLACDLRIAAPEARLGLPETRMGLIPGAGGTQRLPRIVGEERAIDMILNAQIISATEAYEQGLIDELICAPQLEERAWNCLSDACAALLPNRRAAPPAGCRSYAEADMDFAAQRLVKAVKAARLDPPDLGYAIERALFLECLASDTAQRRLNDFVRHKAANKQTQK